MRRYQELNLPKGDNTQARKQAHKVEQYHEQKERKDQTDQGNKEDESEQVMQYDAYRAFYAQLSKITRQVWRFLKNCIREKSSLALYQRQLKPILQAYL